MMNSETNYRRLIEVPIPVWFEGWVSDTVTLMRNGWEFMVDHDTYRGEAVFAIRNHSLKLYGISEGFDSYGAAMYHYDMVRRYHDYNHIDNMAYNSERMRGRRDSIIIRQVCTDIQIRGYQPNFMMMRTPFLRYELYHDRDSMQEIPSFHLSKAPWFDVIDTGENNIILESECETSQLLARILENQEDKQKEIREKLRKRKDKEENVNCQVSAKIITLRS